MAGPPAIVRKFGYSTVNDPRSWPQRDPRGLVFLFRALERLGVPGVGSNGHEGDLDAAVERILTALEKRTLVAVRYGEDDKSR